MPESRASRLLRWKFNFFPAYRGSGARVTYIAGDLREVHVELPLSWRTRNYVGTIFGGSIYAAVDPMYMVMLIRILGREYVVWDKAATIRFAWASERTSLSVPHTTCAGHGKVSSIGQSCGRTGAPRAMRCSI